jgi:hypothetical protein
MFEKVMLKFGKKKPPGVGGWLGSSERWGYVQISRPPWGREIKK